MYGIYIYLIIKTYYQHIIDFHPSTLFFIYFFINVHSRMGSTKFIWWHLIYICIYLWFMTYKTFIPRHFSRNLFEIVSNYRHLGECYYRFSITRFKPEIPISGVMTWNFNYEFPKGYVYLIHHDNLYTFLIRYHQKCFILMRV